MSLLPASHQGMRKVFELLRYRQKASTTNSTESPSAALTRLPLRDHSKTTRSKPSDQKESKRGFFTKILEPLGFRDQRFAHEGCNIKVIYYNIYGNFDVQTIERLFERRQGADANVDDVLRNSQEQCASFITSIAVATRVRFASSKTDEREHEGSVGVSSPGVSLGPSGSKKRKTVLELSHTDDGPVTLAFMAQKLQLREDGSLGAENHVEGEYFGNDEKKYVVDVDANLSSADVEELQVHVVVDEVSNEEYNLYA
ncbi:hypothetical protein PMIN03_001866 [Paraphaeosphaeria minitans]